MITAERQKELNAELEKEGERRLREWKESRGWKKAQGGVCFNRLLGKKCSHEIPTIGPPCQPPGSDHSSLWHRLKDGEKEFVLVTQPYGQTFEAIKEMIAWCEEKGLSGEIDPWPGWHNPGGVLHIEIKKKKE